MSHAGMARNMLDNRFDSALVAIWTYAMLRFGAALRYFQAISQNIRESRLPKLLQFVPLLFSIPCFVASNFCFKRAYSINLRRMRKLGLDSALLRVYEGGLDIG